MSATSPPDGSWAEIASHADGVRHIELAMIENCAEIDRVIAGERDPELRALLERERPRVEAQIRQLLEQNLDEVWAAHRKREGLLD